MQVSLAHEGNHWWKHKKSNSKGFLINNFYLKEFIGEGKITFQRLPGGFLRGAEGYSGSYATESDVVFS